MWHKFPRTRSGYWCNVLYDWHVLSVDAYVNCVTWKKITILILFLNKMIKFQNFLYLTNGSKLNEEGKDIYSRPYFLYLLYINTYFKHTILFQLYSCIGLFTLLFQKKKYIRVYIKTCLFGLLCAPGRNQRNLPFHWLICDSRIDNSQLLI